MRRLLALIVALVLTGTPLGALGTGMQAAAAHACCTARMQAGQPCRMLVLSCCRTAPQPDRRSTVPPANGSLVAAPELLAAHGTAAVVPEMLVTARGFALIAHAEGRFKSPPDPVYLRNAVFLV